ncbi:MAG TPA: RstR family transcriptional repressor [Massilibacterium sp.]|nr:RstR family transcriptional repressor [Massilibacterium sp.]
MLSKRLKYLRKKKGLSQQNMADFLGISRQGYGKYEDGKSEPDNKSLVKLAKYFGVSTDWLLGRDEEDAEEQERIDMIDKIISITDKYPDMGLAFNDLFNMDAKDLKEVYEFIKYKVYTKKGD